MDPYLQKYFLRESFKLIQDYFLKMLELMYPCDMNRLEKESSAYLLQHANNPVDWWPWSAEAMETAASSEKWILISIGYSACHWCHVMEKEIFEDQNIAYLMNKYFINIKVDREEHTDVDHAYMSASIALTGTGGWPLNVVCLPDGRPIWASTYMPKKNWINAINKLQEVKLKSPSLAEEYAEKLIVALKEEKEKKYPLKEIPGWEIFKENIFKRWDVKNGGTNGSPKFPMPHTLMQYLLAAKLPGSEKHAINSLKYIYQSGTYDILRGGLFRYSTDAKWIIPHFEKMLYDNALWIRFTAKAFHINGDILAYESFKLTKKWLFREMELPSGLFSAAIDADSDGEEGKSYIWTETELDLSLGDLSEEFKINLQKNSTQLENRGWILHYSQEKKTDSKWNLSLEKLRLIALKRNLPFIDNKSICSWNALTCIALVEGFLASGEDFEKVKKSSQIHWAEFQLESTYPIHIIYPGSSKKNKAFIDDLAFSAMLALRMSQATLDLTWLKKCSHIVNHILDNFSDDSKKDHFLYSPRDHPNQAFIDFEDWEDDTIPSSLAVLAECLIVTGHLTGNEEKRNRGEILVERACNRGFNYPDRYASWINLLPFSKRDSKHLLLSSDHKIHPLPFFKSPLWGPGINEDFLGQVCNMESCQTTFRSIKNFPLNWAGDLK